MTFPPLPAIHNVEIVVSAGSWLRALGRYAAVGHLKSDHF